MRGRLALADQARPLTPIIGHELSAAPTALDRAPCASDPVGQLNSRKLPNMHPARMAKKCQVQKLERALAVTIRYNLVGAGRLSQLCSQWRSIFNWVSK